MVKKYLFLLLGFLACTFHVDAQVQTISATYSAGDIPTSYDVYDSTCNGASTALTITLPSTTGNWEVVGVDIAYDMTADTPNFAYMSEQRSRISFQNNGFTENTISGVGSSPGTYSYSRTNLPFANGFYPGNTNLIFEMQAWRTYGTTPDCGTDYNKVDNNTWVITVHYQVPPTCLSPSNVQIGSETNVSVDVAWTDTNTTVPASWNIEYGAPGFTQGTGMMHVATTNPTTIGGLTTDTDYELYIQADCGTTDGASFWEGPFAFSTTIDCSIYTLDITSHTGATVACQGTATLTATATGNGDDIFWYDAAVGGNIVGSGNTFVTPVISSTTSYWAAEVKLDNVAGGSSGGLQTYCIPTYANPCSSNDYIEDFIMTDAGINHVGSGCSPSNYGDYTNDSSLYGNLSIGSTYNFTVNHNPAWSQGVKIWIDLNQDGDFDDAGELLFTSSGTATTHTGSITIPAANGGPTVMRVMDRFGGIPTNSCTPGSTYGEVHDYRVIIGEVACASPRQEVVATVNTNGDIQVTTLPYNDPNNDTANYGDPFAGTPGANCNTAENYLNGNNVVYKFTAQNTELVDILLSDLTDFYASVFVYDNCGEIGNNCIDGAIAGPSDDDFGIMEFPVTAGEDYYIVVSSWLTPTIGYTLDIIPFNCSTLETPNGDSPQDFTTGELISDLEVIATRNNATLNWYAGPGATNPIPDTTALVDGVTYYVTQTFNGCESAPLAITVDEIDCSSLEINLTTTGSVSCQGQVTMTATASGSGSGIYWYDAPMDGNVVATGNTFTTPVLTSTTSYWVAEINLVSGSVGGSLPSGYCVPNYTNPCSSNDYIEDFIMTDAGINHIGTGCSPGNYADYTNDSSLTGTMSVGQSYDFTVNHNPAWSQGVKIYIDLDRDGSFDEISELLYTSSGTATTHSGSITIPATAGGPTIMRVIDRFGGIPVDACTPGSGYGETHDYKVIIGEVLCESIPRTEVVATVNQTGNVVVDYMQLPYTTTDSTSVYGDNFQGDPGSSCPGTDYLGGNEVIYQYTADPVNDDILQIELSGITNPNTGMYIYTSCGEVGTNCLTGVTNEGSQSSMSISDYYINAGDTIFIVISSENNTVNYTLDIYGFDCSMGPLVDVDTAPYFVQPDVLDDIVIETDPNSTSYTWYADAALTMPIADPTTEPLVDGMTYYVTQTILGCESDAVAVTAIEFDCNAMGVTQADDVIICAPGGEVELNGQSTGIGYDIFWYDAPSGGNVVAAGANPTVNVTQTTSFWAAEVYMGGSFVSGPVNTNYCIPSYANACSSNDLIEDFIMPTAGINHTGSGCSPNNYGDFTNDPSLVGNLSIGVTYNFTVNHNPAWNQGIKIFIDLNQDGDFNDPNELLYTSSSANITHNGSITIPAANGGPTVLRIVDTFSSAPTSACTPGSGYGETHDYKVIIGTILCESTREEVVVTVNDQATAEPTGDALQKLCTGATIADLIATGTDLQWYGSDTATTPLALNYQLVNGETYYVSQTIDACESQTRLAVTVDIKDVAPLPTGPTNQDFVQGETLLDLTVAGADLIWYTSINGLQFTEVVDPSQVVLTDQTTYYVTQTPNGFCESDKLPITVHRVVGLDHPNFDGLTYYPNPVRDYLSVTNRKAIDGIVVFNLLGQQVISEKMSTTETRIDMSYLAAGSYMVKITVEDKSTMVKIMKE